MADLLLVVRLAGRRIALPASDVEAVVELEGITPVPRTAAHIAGLAALRSRVLTVVDAAASLEQASLPNAGATEAIVVISDGHPYAILVEAVEDVIESGVEPRPVQAPLGHGWSRVADTMVDVDGELLLLVDPHRIIQGPAALAA